MFSRFAAELDITLDTPSLTYLASQSNSLTGYDIKRIIQLSLNEAHFRKVSADLNETRMTYLSGSNAALEIILSLPDRWLTGETCLNVNYSNVNNKLSASRSGARHCSLLNPHAKKMSFVTCLPCFGRLGHVMSLRDGDSRAVTRGNLKADIGVALAGKIVEKMFNSGLSSSGCSSDLAKAKLLAHDYVVTYGFSPIGTSPSDPGPAMQNQIDVEKTVSLMKRIWMSLIGSEHESALTEGYVAGPVVPPEEYIAVPSDSVMEEYVAGR
ncbi:hypothetical protein niasHT_016589 [Heterodera trifolii]|uniref:Peptidase M41 domain-containing protein n=1 Tax=Heterodera trifolii TaxID=157864 RepID=A0ABD2L9N0_9BILA